MDLKALIHPFDPVRNKPVQLPTGAQATEYSVTSQAPDGTWLVHPQIWWRPDGSPMYIPNEQGLAVALAYERMAGHKFPRFKTAEEADAFASGRSKHGGGLLGMIGD